MNNVVKIQNKRSELLNIEEKLDIMNSVMVTIGNEVLTPTKDRPKKKYWMTDEI